MGVDSLLGEVLRGRYEVVELIGEGGMARVYRGVDRRLSRPVVLKVLKKEWVDHDEFRQRFAREASSAARLAHSNIIKVHDVDEENGVPFIVQEYYPAQDLKAILKTVGKLSPERVVQIAEEILDALDYAHSQGIIHRDLKPHNVLITDRSEVKITDFGIAKAVGSDSLTRTGTMMGTAYYISPEQVQGDTVSPQSDLYSLGVMLYEMLCGRLPFEGDSAITVAFKHVQEPPPSLSARGAVLPGALEEVVLTALRKHPADRYRDAQAMRRALTEAAEALDGKPRPSNGLSAGRHGDKIDDTIVRPAVPKDPAPVMPAYSLADSGEFQAAPPVPPPPIEPPRSRARSAFVGLLGIVVLASIVYAAYLFIAPQPDVKVPAVVGLSEEDARQKVEKLNLRLTVKEFVYSDEEPGIVKSQSPEPGTSLRRGHDVLVVISKGRQTVQVPPLAGLDRVAARQALEERGLTAKWQEDYNDTVPVGRVATQDPPGGTSVDLHARVTVTISKGIKQVQVPRLVGINEKDAQAAAEDVGLKVHTVTQKPSGNVPKGNVLEQSPRQGTRVSKGSTINIVISSGPEARVVPSVKTMTLVEARNTLEQQGFSVVVDNAGASPSPESRVASQEPEAGVMVSQGTVVRLTIEAPSPTPEAPDEQVVVPNVTHMGIDAARAALEERGLHAGATEPEGSDDPEGTVLRQSPEEGAMLKRGSTVDLVIAVKRHELPLNK